MNIEKLDKQIGEIINQLKADGLYENTVIFSSVTMEALSHATKDLFMKQAFVSLL